MPPAQECSTVCAFMKSMLSGMIIGFLIILMSASFASVIFTGALVEFLPAGIGMMLITGVITGGLISLTSSYSGSISTPQDRTAPFLALVAASVTAALTSKMGIDDPAALFANVVGVILLTTILTGIILVLIGISGGGRLMRFVPFPVVGGVMAGTGCLLIMGGLEVMAGFAIERDTIHLMAEPHNLKFWLPGLLLGLVLLTIMRKANHVLVLPTVLLLGTVAFHVITDAYGIPLEQLRDEGWTLSMPDGDVMPVPLPMVLGMLDWQVVLANSIWAATILLVSALSLMITAGSLELEARREIDINHEMKAAGLANILSGFAGGMIGFHSMSLSRLALSLRSAYRATGVLAAAVCGLFLFLDVSVFEYIPNFILGTVLIYLGLTFVYEWVLVARHKLSKGDYAIVLLILFAVIAVGLLEGVGVGILTAVMLFVTRYSRINVVRNTLSGDRYRSNVERTSQQLGLLEKHGSDILVLKLQGYIFFGTAHELNDRLLKRIEDKPEHKPRYIILDFERITGLDSSTAIAFIRLEQIAQKHDFSLLISAIQPHAYEQLSRNGFNEDGKVHLFPDLDRVMEHCEGKVLAAAGEDVESHQQADIHPEFTDLLKALGDRGVLDAVRLEEGETLVEQGTPSDELFFVASGKITASIRIQTDRNIRLRVFGPGTVLGEVSWYRGTPRSASLIAESDSLVYRLSKEALPGVEQSDPHLVSRLHRFIATLLSERLMLTNASLSAVLE